MRRTWVSRASKICEAIEKIAFDGKENSVVADQHKSSCSFCGRDQSAVRILVVGPLVDICDECVDICSEIISEKVSSGETAVASPPSPTFTCGLCGQPTPSIHGVAIPDRGAVCVACFDAVVAASHARDSVDRD